MLFNSIRYALFLPIVLAIFWASPQRWRVPILLVASYVFYMSWRPQFVILILGLTLINYFLGHAIWRSELKKKAWLTLAVVANLSVLVFFKYAYFLDNVTASIFAPFGIVVPKLPFDIILPLGISFFVFEFIHYVTDVYRGSEPIKSFPAFALFASFFPTQIAGPIKRFQDFIPQFVSPAKFCMEHFDDGVALILLGLFKKVLIADNLAFFVQGGFSHPELFSGLDLWLFTYAFAFQIYFDFSGYTDIARGSAMLFGYKVPINFNLPYLATNIAEFWHRWHISLSTWLRDYLFIPLGGSRCSKWLNMRNLIITMTLGGLWHGAAMHYVFWGLYHGLLLVLHRKFSDVRKGLASLSKFMDTATGKLFSTILTFHAVCLGWIFFRAENTAGCIQIFEKVFFLDALRAHTSLLQMNLPAINYPLIYPAIYLLLPVLAVAHFVMGRIDKTKWVANTPTVLKAAWCVAMILAIMIFSPDKSPRFIYFQF